MTENFWGHIGYIAIAVGMFQIARGSISGWGVRLIGEVIWIGIGVSLGMSSVWIWGLVFVGIDIVGMRGARKTRKGSRTASESVVS